MSPARRQLLLERDALDAELDVAALLQVLEQAADHLARRAHAAGDLLVTSSTLGRARKGTDRARMLGAVVGKALEPLRERTGIIQVLVTLQ